MEAKTITNLNQLRIGDSFLFTKGDRKTVWRIKARADKNNRVAINQWLDTGRWLNPYDDQKRGNNKVMFLRHTIPVAGEDCLIDDLKPGDTFFRPEDIVHEYVMVKHGHQFSDVRRTDEAACIKAGRFAKVIFIKHKDQ